MARVRDDYLGMTFVDTLSFLKANGRWTMMDDWTLHNKLFHVEGPTG